MCERGRILTFDSAAEPLFPASPPFPTPRRTAPFGDLRMSIWRPGCFAAQSTLDFRVFTPGQFLAHSLPPVRAALSRHAETGCDWCGVDARSGPSEPHTRNAVTARAAPPAFRRQCHRAFPCLITISILARPAREGQGESRWRRTRGGGRERPREEWWNGGIMGASPKCQVQGLKSRAKP
jgi:hypothetical protein